MRRCTLVIPDAGPFNSLWVADQLSLLLALQMRLIVVDAVYGELTCDLAFPKDRDVKAFIDGHRPPFEIVVTDTGREERAKRKAGKKLKRNAGEIAIVDFMSAEDGLHKYLQPGDPVAILFEDSGLRVFNRPPNLHLLSTAGMLRGLERVGVIKSADAIIHDMTHPKAPDRRVRSLVDLPNGIDEPVAIGTEWLPET